MPSETEHSQEERGFCPLGQLWQEGEGGQKQQHRQAEEQNPPTLR